MYLAAAQRLGLSDDAAGYWELHIREDERHGRQMVEDVALPLVDRCESRSSQLTPQTMLTCAFIPHATLLAVCSFE